MWGPSGYCSLRDIVHFGPMCGCAASRRWAPPTSTLWTKNELETLSIDIEHWKVLMIGVINSTAFPWFNTTELNVRYIIELEWTELGVTLSQQIQTRSGKKKPCIHSSAQTTLDIPYALHLSIVPLHTCRMEILSYANRIYRTNNIGSLQISNLVDSKSSQCLWQGNKVKAYKPPLYTRNDQEFKINIPKPSRNR